jgi:hypothetical protein
LSTAAKDGAISADATRSATFDNSSIGVRSLQWEHQRPLAHAADQAGADHTRL